MIKNKNTGRKRLRLAWLLPCLLLMMLCKETGPARTARIHFFTGKVEIVARGMKMAPSIGGVLGEGDTVITGPSSSIDLMAGDYTAIRIGEKTRVTLASVLGAGKSEGRFNLGGGSLFVVISRLGKGDSVKIVTPTAAYAVRGTAFRARADEGWTSVAVLTGKVEVWPSVEGVERERPVTVERGHWAEIPTSKAGPIAAGKVPIQVRPLADRDKETLTADFLDVKRRVIDSQAPVVRERFRGDVGEIERERALRLRGEKERALRESLEAKKKAELEEQLRKESEKKKKEDEARARAKVKKAAAKQKTDRSGDISGTK